MSYTPTGYDSSRPAGSIAETIPRKNVIFSNATGPATGVLGLYAITLPGGVDVSTITFVTNATAAASPTNQWFCLCADDRTVLAKTADDTTTAWAANTAKTLTVTSGPYRTTRTGLYYVGVVVVASTMPAYCGITDISNTQATAIAPIINGNSTTGLTNPASLGATAGAITAGIRKIYAYVS